MAFKRKYVSQLLEENYRYAAVLHQYGIDFFDHLDRTLDEACRLKKVSIEKINMHLGQVGLNLHTLERDFSNYSAGRLSSYLEKSHHNYAQVMLPIIQHHIDRTASAYGKDFPHLHLLGNIFDSFRKDFLTHIYYENTVVFPYIRKLEKHAMQFRHNFLLDVKDFTLDHFIMKHAHDDDDMMMIRKLTDNYKTEESDHIAYKILMAELQDFENDLKTHSRIEEKILFGKAQKLEKRIFKQVQDMARAN